MEEIWGVVYVDADKEEDADEGSDEDEDEDEDMDSSSQSPHASEFEVEGGMPQIKQVSGARDDIINGTYQLLATTRHVVKLPLPAGLVHVCNGKQLNCQHVHLLQGRVWSQGVVVHRTGAPPSSLPPCHGRRRIGSHG